MNKSNRTSIALRSALAVAMLAQLALPLGQVARAQSPDDVIRSLEPASPEAANEGARVRSVPLRVDGERTSVWVNYQYARDFSVYFPSGQSELTEVARRQLASLGHALRSERLRNYRYLIAGHTDAYGPAEYNRILSLRRAEAVRNFLTHEFGIDPRRLMVTGWGFEQLKDPRNPYSGVNRRVEIVLLATRREPPPPAVSMDRDCAPGETRRRPDLDDFGTSGPCVPVGKNRIIINTK